jgi:hypothetical protein
MAKKEDGKEPTEFPLTLDEFLIELPKAQVETKAGFRHVMQANKIGGAKLRSEWGDLLSLYQKQPSRMSWVDWTKSQDEAIGKGGN